MLNFDDKFSIKIPLKMQKILPEDVIKNYFLTRIGKYEHDQTTFCE